jgi:hypothetical protein
LAIKKTRTAGAGPVRIDVSIGQQLNVAPPGCMARQQQHATAEHAICFMAGTVSDSPG